MHQFDLPSAYTKAATAAGLASLPSSVPHLYPAASSSASTSTLLPAPVTPSAPSTFCSKCGAVRTDVRFACCGACLHARCVFPWPRKDCPICHRPVKGVQILPLEPFYRNGELVEVAEKPSKLRAGRWLEAELNLAETVMKGFNTGMLPLEDGTRLGNFICDLLQCTSARLSSKLRTGKRCFKYCGDVVGPDKILEYEQQQRHLSKLEEIFLHYLTKEEAAVASRYLQLEWRAQFVGMSDKLGQDVENRSSWVALLAQQHRHPGEMSSHQNQNSVASHGSIASRSRAPPSDSSVPIATRRRPPPPPPTNRQSLLAMLVQMMIDRRQRYTVGQKTLGDLLEVLQQVSETDCCLLARANNWAALFVSAGLRRLLGFDQQGAEENLLGVSLIGAKGAILHPGDARPVDLARQHSLREINRLIDTMGNPQTSLMDVHINVFPLTIRLKGRGGTYVQHVMSLLATDDFILLHASGAPSKAATIDPYPSDPFVSASSTATTTTTPVVLRTEGTEYAPTTVPPTVTSASALSAAPPISGMLKRMRDFDDLDSHEEEPPPGRMRGAADRAADMAMAFLTDFLGTGNQGDSYDVDEDDLSLEGLMGDDDYIEADSKQSGSASSPGQQSPIPYRDNYDLYYSPPASFEQTMHNFLRHLPFEAVDIWVPIFDPKSGCMQLHFGGGAAVNPELQQWIYYSKNFQFAPNQGVPGRVFCTGNPEFQDDVSSLDNQVFLRRDGAQLVGVHSTYGVPIIQPEMQNVLVLVFYSRSHTGCITSALQEFIRRSTASWRISTNVLTTSIG